MSTSLAEQLQRLAVPQSNVFKQGKKRPSLLFDTREAANLDRDTVYQIGLDGFEELKLKNPVFIQFETSLFDESSKSFVRSVQSREVNDKLNKNIKRFMLLLSPFFLLNCSHKALEWLVNRFYIHEYNKEEFLLLILPYHETNIFVRALQLLDLKQPNDKWHWLKPLQKPGIHLPKSVLLNHAASDVYFLQFISNFILSIIKEHENPNVLTVVFNFYCATFTGALEYSQSVSEAQVSQMLPALLKGLKSSVPDYVASSYVVTAKLMSKTQLSDAVLGKMVENVCQNNVSSLRTETILVLIVIYQSQLQYKVIPEEALKQIAFRDWVPKIIQELSNSGCYIKPFLEALFRGMIRLAFLDDDEVYRNFIESVINEVKFEDIFVGCLLNIILDVYHLKRQYEQSSMLWLRKFINKIEVQYPASFDNEVRNIMKASQVKGDKRQRKLQSILKDSMNLRRKFEVFEKLYHPIPEIRKDAIQVLVKNYSSLKKKEKELLQNSLIDRLNDENYAVVQETLSLFGKKLSAIIDKKILSEILIKLLNKSQECKEIWWRVSYVAFEMLSDNLDPADTYTFMAILPFLLPISEHELKIRKRIINSNYAKQCAMLRPILESFRKPENRENISSTVFSSFKAKNLPEFKLLLAKLTELPAENQNALYKYLASVLVCFSLPENCSADVNLLVLTTLLSFLRTSETAMASNASTSGCISLARGGKYPLQGFLLCTEKLIVKTGIPVVKLGLLDLSIGSEAQNFFVILLDMLLEGCYQDTSATSAAYASNLKFFFKHFCTDFVSYIEFLLNISVAESKFVSPKLQLRCLRAVKSLVQRKQDSISDCVTLKGVSVPYLAVCLCNSYSEIRATAVDIIFHILKNSKVENVYVSLLKGLFDHKDEILLDHEQMPLIMYNLLSTALQGNQSATQTLNCLLNLTVSSKYPAYLKAGLLVILAHINSTEIYTRTSDCAAKMLSEILNSPETVGPAKSQILYRNIIRFDSDIAKDITVTSSIWHFITMALKNDRALITYEKTKTACPSVLAINQLDRDVFDKLNADLQVSVLDVIVEMATNSQNAEVLSSTGRVFKRIDLDLTLVLQHLVKMRDVESPKQVNTRRKRKVIVPTVDILDTNEWKKGITVLEYIQDKKKIRNVGAVMSVLFDILKRCLDFDEQGSVEYPKQLVLSAILHCCMKLENEKLPENVFNMELVVQCIRASPNPQTHHHALLVLAHMAVVTPDQVLHHIMAIFTFMGSSVLRHDDTYSFYIITKIIDNIVPLLVESENEGSVITVLRVFVDAILDVPEHRRIPLFKKLLMRLGAENNLHLFLLLIFEAHIAYGAKGKQASSNRSLVVVDEVAKRLDVAANFCREFAPDVVILTCTKLVEYLRALPEEKDDNVDKNPECSTFSIKNYTPKQFRHYKYTTVTFIANLLASKEFVNRVATLSNEEILNLEEPFKRMIINILTYIQVTSKIVAKSSTTPQAHYWKVMLHHSYDILDSLNALLTPQMFLLVVRGLMVHHLKTVRRRALELLNTKLQNNAPYFNDCNEDEVYALVPPVINLIKSGEEENIDTEQELLIQTALLSLKLLVRLLAQDNPGKFVPILEFVTDLIKLKRVEGNILASVVLCLAELCCNLRAHAISSLNNFMPVILKVLKVQKKQETPDLLLLSIVTAVQKILDSLPLFISPYLEKLLTEVSSLSCRWNSDREDQKLAPLVAKLHSIQKKLGSLIPARVLIPAIEQSYNAMLEKSKYDAIGALMNILAESVGNLNGPLIQANLHELTNFFLNALQFRADGNTTCEQANQVEAQIIKALTVLVLKLSETMFRPLYYRLFDWAVRTDDKSERAITFYNLSSRIAETLKGLFVLFVGHFLNNSATLLDACNNVKNEELYYADDTKNALLLEYILKTLHSVFLYDTQKFMNKERFEVLMQPVVDQLENTVGGVEVFQNRVRTLVIPSIAQLATAVGDDALWKQMNYQVLLKMRHSDPNIRLLALNCLSEITRKVGEDFLPLLPETIPFLAELLEDEDENVEKVCQKAVQELEKILGEPLQKYF